MSSIKPIYQNNAVYIRAIHNRKKAIKKIVDLDKIYWSGDKVKKSHPKANLLNRLISKRLEAAQSVLFSFQVDNVEFEAKDLLNTVKNSENSLTVCQAIYKKSVELKDKPKAYRKLTNLKNHFSNYGDCDILDFDIDKMRGFERYLNARPKINSLETSARYLKDLKRCLRSVDDYNNRQVLEYRLTFGSKPKDKLTINEIERIRAYNNEKYNLSRDAFLTCFYTHGSRISSALTLTPQNIIDDRLNFIEYKGQIKRKSLKINEPLNEIIDRYKGQSSFYLLPILDLPPEGIDKYIFDKHIEAKTSKINKDLKVIAAACGINKNISTHVARHSFAYISHTVGVETRLIQKMLGHTTFQMTENYIKSLSIDDDIDKASDMVY